MTEHVCHLPEPVSRLDRAPREDWTCPACGWVWRVNRIVHQWFRCTPT